MNHRPKKEGKEPEKGKATEEEERRSPKKKNVQN